MEYRCTDAFYVLARSHTNPEPCPRVRATVKFSMPFHSLTQHQNAEARCAPRFIHALVARRTSRTRDVARRAVCRRKSERRAASPAHPNAPAPARRQGGSSGHERVRGAKAPPPARAPRTQSATRTSVSHRNTGHTHTYMLCIIYCSGRAVHPYTPKRSDGNQRNLPRSLAHCMTLAPRQIDPACCMEVPPPGASLPCSDIRCTSAHRWV